MKDIICPFFKCSRGRTSSSFTTSRVLSFQGREVELENIADCKIEKCGSGCCDDNIREPQGCCDDKIREPQREWVFIAAAENRDFTHPYRPQLRQLKYMIKNASSTREDHCAHRTTSRCHFKT
jgi:hypothetical protein